MFVKNLMSVSILSITIMPETYKLLQNFHLHHYYSNLTQEVVLVLLPILLIPLQVVYQHVELIDTQFLHDRFLYLRKICILEGGTQPQIGIYIAEQGEEPFALLILL